MVLLQFQSRSASDLSPSARLPNLQNATTVLFSLATDPWQVCRRRNSRKKASDQSSKSSMINACQSRQSARLHAAALILLRVFDPPEDSPVQRFSRSVVPQGRRVKDQTFGFDKIFDENTTQGDVYEATTRGLLDSVLDGYNATVFAYGATGCGKTHTITYGLRTLKSRGKFTR